MNHGRRKFIAALGIGGLAAAGWRYWPDGGLWNACLDGPLPGHLAQHDLVQAAWEGIDPARVWDGHVHLIGVGDNDSGIWITPKMDSLAHPKQYVQKRFYMNAGCSEVVGQIDKTYIDRLLALHDDFPQGMRSLVLAFDYAYDEPQAGKPQAPNKSHSSFYVPNEYARQVAAAHPDRFEWMGSIHPYREDCVEVLRDVVSKGARAIKWLPPAQGMDPANKLCIPFYDEMAKLNVPLLVHAGAEEAVEGGDTQDYGNPLRLRLALDRGVRVIVAHCASLGQGVDLDVGPNGPLVDNFELFVRLMDEKQYQGRVFGEISTVTQVNRIGAPLEAAILRDDWQGRLINASDYPLPGLVPLFSLSGMVEKGYMKNSEREVLMQIREYNPLLFDFVCKRSIRIQGKRLKADIFHSRHMFDNQLPDKPVAA